MSIFDAAMAYAEEGTPLVIIARQGVRQRLEPRLGGQRAPSCSACAPCWWRVSSAFTDQTWWAWACCPCSSCPARAPRRTAGRERRSISITGLEPLNHGETVPQVTLHVTRDNGETFTFEVRLRIDTPTEAEYFRHGGVLNFVLRQLARASR